MIRPHLNFVVFEIRMSQQEVGWVVSNKLYQQETVDGLKDSLTFPADAVEAKAAWRILPDDMPQAQKDRYYHEAATIVLDPQHVAGGGTAPVCVTRELGLIGLHLRRNGLWATFEQVDNVTPSNGGFTPRLNGWWQQSVLQGTVWANYMLITTNWTEVTSSQPIPALNTALEPYIPADAKKYPQACIECHKLAVNGNNAALGESFMPFRACPQNPRPGQKLPANCIPGKVTTLAAHH